MPQQRLELAAKDAEELELENGTQVTVSVNGTSVEARVAIRERMRPGAAFLIEGTAEGNANVLAERRPAADRGEAEAVIPLAEVDFAEATWVDGRQVAGDLRRSSSRSCRC